MKPKNGTARTKPVISRDLLMPIVSILVVLIPIVVMRPRVLSYGGLQLLLNMAVPVTLVTLAQMFAMTIGEIDFSLGNLVSLVTCVAGSVISKNLALGIAFLAGILAVYMVVGAFLYLKKLPSIVVTIGLSFVWTGLAITIQPHPGGNVPMVLQDIMGLRLPLIPVPVLYLAILAAAGFVVVNKTNFGILIRGIGGNEIGRASCRERV